MAKRVRYGIGLVYIVLLLFGYYVGQKLGDWSGYEWTRPVEKYQLDRPITNHHLYNKVEVFCWIPTHAALFKTNARAVTETWGPHCNRIMFVSNISDDRLPLLIVKLNDTREELWQKTRAAFTWIYDNILNDYDWFLKADDDTYIHMDNLRKLLEKYSPYDTIALGHQYNPGYLHAAYHSGGAGYVLSRAAVKRLVSEGFSRIDSCNRPDYNEDMFIGNCLNDLNITIVDGADKDGTYRFHPIGVFDFLEHRVPDWMKDMSKTEVKESFACCSPHFISMHYTTAEMQHLLHYLIHYLRPYGVQY